MMLDRRLGAMLWLALLLLLSACQSPCERTLPTGYLRHEADITAIPFRFDYPSDWKIGDGVTLEKADSAGAGRTILVQFYSAGLEKYPHIYQEGQILTGQDWGSPFPGREMKIATRKLDLAGHPGLTVSFDFDTPQILMDGSSPVTDWGYMQFTFIVIGNSMMDIRFYASDQGEGQIRREFDKLINSICIPLAGGGTDD